MQSRNTLSIEQQLMSSATNSLEILTCHIGILQQIQRLFNCMGQPEVTLADIHAFLVDFQQEYGLASPIEEVIQTLISHHLLLQYQMRQQSVKRIVA